MKHRRSQCQSRLLQEFWKSSPNIMRFGPHSTDILNIWQSVQPNICGRFLGQLCFVSCDAYSIVVFSTKNSSGNCWKIFYKLQTIKVTAGACWASPKSVTAVSLHIKIVGCFWLKQKKKKRHVVDTSNIFQHFFASAKNIFTANKISLFRTHFYRHEPSAAMMNYIASVSRKHICRTL